MNDGSGIKLKPLDMQSSDWSTHCQLVFFIFQRFSSEQMVTLVDAMTHLEPSVVPTTFNHLLHLREQEVVLRALYHITASIQPNKVNWFIVWMCGWGWYVCVHV